MYNWAIDIFLLQYLSLETYIFQYHTYKMWYRKTFYFTVDTLLISLSMCKMYTIFRKFYFTKRSHIIYIHIIIHCILHFTFKLFGLLILITIIYNELYMPVCLCVSIYIYKHIFYILHFIYKFLCVCVIH